MVGRRRRQKRPVDIRKQRVPTRYYQRLDESSLELNALAVGSEASVKLVDNSVDFTGSVVKFTKLTVQIFEIGMDDSRNLLMAIVRDTEDATEITLDTLAAVRDNKQAGKLLRGPWLTGTLVAGRESSRWDRFFKTIVMKTLTLDENDDLTLQITNRGPNAFGGTSQIIGIYARGYYRVVG